MKYGTGQCVPFNVVGTSRASFYTYHIRGNASNDYNRMPNEIILPAFCTVFVLNFAQNPHFPTVVLIAQWTLHN